MKTVNDLTINEYNKYLELISEESFDTFSLLELMGYVPDKLKVSQLNVIISTITSTPLKTTKVKRYYKVGKWTLRANLNLTKITAAQFIDLQNYLQDFKLEQVLTVFLVPCKKTLWGYKQLPYADRNHYLVEELQEDLLNHFSIAEANTLSSFFFSQSMALLKVMKEYGEKKLVKMKMKKFKKELK